MANTSLTSDSLVIGQDLWTTSTTQQMPLGAKASSPDGRAYRYGRVGAVASVAGRVYQGPTDVAASFQSLQVVTSTGVAGSTALTTTTAVTWTVNQLAGGFLTIVGATTGVGIVYRIAGNTAATAAAGTIYLEDPVFVTMAATIVVDIVLSPFSGLIVCPATLTSAPVGVSTIAIPALSYGWFQTYGVCGILNDSATGPVAAGVAISPSNAIVGAVRLAVAGAPIIGYSVSTLNQNESGMIYLTIG